MQPAAPAGALGAAALDDHVADLAGRAAAEPGLAVEDSPPPTPVPQKTPIRLWNSSPGAEVELGFGRDLDVVADLDLGPEVLLERFAEREAALPAGQVAGRGDDAGLLVGVARRADPDALPAREVSTPAAFGGLAQRLGHRRGDVLRARRSVGVGCRASPLTSPAPSTIAVWILVPPRSMPPRRSASARESNRRAVNVRAWRRDGLADLVGEAALVRAQPSALRRLADRSPRRPRRLLRPPPGRGRDAGGARRGAAADRRRDAARAGLLADARAGGARSRSARAASSTATR